MTITPAERTRRLLATRPYHRNEPWSTNYLTAAYLAFALGISEDCPPDRDFQHAYHPGDPRFSDFATEARHTPLALAYALALRAQGRNEEADDLLGATEIPAPVVEAKGETEAPAEEPEADSGAQAEPGEPSEPSPAPEEATATPLPEDFPMRDALTDAGYPTLEAIDAASDSDLLKITGVGDAKLSLIRAGVTEATS